MKQYMLNIVVVVIGLPDLENSKVEHFLDTSTSTYPTN